MDLSEATRILEGQNYSNVRPFASAEDAVAAIRRMYDSAVTSIRDAVEAVIAGTPPSQLSTLVGNYPAVFFPIGSKAPNISPRAAYGYCRNGAGIYGTNLTRPDIFEDYLIEQMRLVMAAHGCEILVANSKRQIPAVFALDGTGLEIPEQFAGHFTRPDPEAIAATRGTENGFKRLAYFSAEEIDYALLRLRHYTWTPPELFTRKFVLLTNYRMYELAFAELGRKLSGADGWARFVEPEQNGNIDGRVPQMPAYHLVRDDGTGISLVNVGVGGPNTRTLMELLAVLRPYGVIFVGHCGGVRIGQRVGGFVIADSYLRLDHMLEDEVPLHRPVPTSLELNHALTDAAEFVYELSHEQIKEFVETAAIATVHNRNWELDLAMLAEIDQSGAAAVDMESAVMAAAGFKFGVPTAALLCISDKPLHGDMKRRGAALEFYQQSAGKHLRIAVRAVDELLGNPLVLQSRRLRQPRTGLAFR